MLILLFEIINFRPLGKRDSLLSWLGGELGSAPLAAVEIESFQGKQAQAGQVRVLDAGCKLQIHLPEVSLQLWALCRLQKQRRCSLAAGEVQRLPELRLPSSMPPLLQVGSTGLGFRVRV